MNMIKEGKTSECVCVEVSVTSVYYRHLCIYTCLWESSKKKKTREANAPQRQRSYQRVTCILLSLGEIGKSENVTAY